MSRFIELITEFNDVSVALRLLLALLMGGLIGMERGRHGRAAGMRTHVLVCVGACMTALVGLYLLQINPNEDASRIAAQVISGIGFLGAGTIMIRNQSVITGLTTAAGLWTSAGVGLALGVGFYEAAAAAGLAVFFVLTVLQRFDNRIHRKARFLELYIEIAESLGIGDVIKQLRQQNVEIIGMQMERRDVDEDGVRALIVTLKAEKRIEHMVLIDKIRKLDGIIHVEEL